MRITPFAVLEEHARKEYQKRFGNVPEPRILNAHALVSFAAPRSLFWGGVGYWVPPLSYESGNRLLAAASFIHDALRQGKDAAAAKAARTGARLLQEVLPRPSAFRRPRQFVRSYANFHREPPQTIEHLLRWMLYVDDESPVVPSDRQVTIDLIDNKYAFEGHFKRKPDSWVDYVYGMRHIGRQTAREDLRSAVSSRMGVNAEKKGWQDYVYELRSFAGPGW